jgi:hypothetical protein
MTHQQTRRRAHQDLRHRPQIPMPALADMAQRLTDVLSPSVLAMRQLERRAPWCISITPIPPSRAAARSAGRPDGSYGTDISCASSRRIRAPAANGAVLRTVMSLAQLWQQQAKRNEACLLLAPIYGWFTEGFDTADL